jgi:glutamine amidotransferase
MTRKVAILSYGTGNVGSLKDALDMVGAQCSVAQLASDLSEVEAIVLPGIGHFRHSMAFLTKSGLLDLTMARIKSGMPVLGICLGMQLLMKSSEESPDMLGLGLFEISAKRIRPSDSKAYKVPHLGWNNLDMVRGSPQLLKGISVADQVFYYANSYAACSTGGDLPTYATFSHGAEYIGLIENASVFGVQFHPEKSREQGLHLLENFLKV